MAQGYEERKRLSFEQAEGAEPLPSQLALKTVSPEMRARLWEVVHQNLSQCQAVSKTSGVTYIREPWRTILYNKHVYRDYRPADDFSNQYKHCIEPLKTLILQDDYLGVLGLLQWILRQRVPPLGFADAINSALRSSRAAYAVFDGDTIVPVGTDAEASTLRKAFADLAAAEFQGARAHLREAGAKLTAGDCPGSVRESIHGVEAVARVLEPAATTLGPALAKLTQSVRIHPAMALGFGKLYGYTSDQQGIRHALVDEAVAEVDEADALYMLGACAAFVSYMINKARNAGLIGR